MPTVLCEGAVATDLIDLQRSYSYDLRIVLLCHATQQRVSRVVRQLDEDVGIEMSKNVNDRCITHGTAVGQNFPYKVVKFGRQFQLTLLAARYFGNRLGSVDDATQTFSKDCCGFDGRCVAQAHQTACSDACHLLRRATVSCISNLY